MVRSSHPHTWPNVACNFSAASGLVLARKSESNYSNVQTVLPTRPVTRQHLKFKWAATFPHCSGRNIHLSLRPPRGARRKHYYRTVADPSPRPSFFGFQAPATNRRFCVSSPHQSAIPWRFRVPIGPKAPPLRRYNPSGTP